MKKFNELTWTKGNKRTDAHGEVIQTYYAEIRFGVFDSKGRELGVNLIIRENEGFFNKGEKAEVKMTSEHCGVYIPHYRAFGSGIQSERNGETFGASFPRLKPNATFEEAAEAAYKSAITSYKKVLKKAAANNGIYK
jgi:hypothetical protein